jgi:hypothetical protein
MQEDESSTATAPKRLPAGRVATSPALAGGTNTRHPRLRAQRRARTGERRVQQGRLGVCLLTGFALCSRVVLTCIRTH